VRAILIIVLRHRSHKWGIRRIDTARFLDTAVNPGNVAKTPDEQVAQWKAEHPDGPVKE